MLTVVNKLKYHDIVKAKILLIYTGGTIGTKAKILRLEHYKAFNFSKLLQNIQELKKKQLDCDIGNGFI
jgi:L-asparaginase/Glu-tRNA(Gln) amidotransferase subunit D